MNGGLSRDGSKPLVGEHGNDAAVRMSGLGNEPELGRPAHDRRPPVRPGDSREHCYDDRTGRRCLDRATDKTVSVILIGFGIDATGPALG
jgi:hypothetical protein